MRLVSVGVCIYTEFCHTSYCCTVSSHRFKALFSRLTAEHPIMKHTIRLSDVSHVSYPATSRLPPGFMEIILLPDSSSSITLGAGMQAGGGSIPPPPPPKKKEKNPGVRYGLYS
jgi:hypothetical protein